MLTRRFGIWFAAALTALAAGTAQAQVRRAVDLSREDAEMVFSGVSQDAGLGETVAVGDINGDGFEDLILGSPGAFLGAGAVYVTYGRAGGFTPQIDLVNPTFTTTAIPGIEAGAAFGASVATGDLNGDGFDDIIAGAPDADPDSKPGAGSVFVVYGRTASLPPQIDLAAGPTGVLRLDGEAPGDGFGKAVGSGNADGDGFSDLIVGAPGGDPNGRTNAGQAYLYYGGQTLSGPVRLAGGATRDALGTSVGAGDLNQDGRDEIILRAPEATASGGIGAGIVYVVAGRVTRLPSPIELGASPLGVSRIFGESERDRLGNGIAVGDVDGDNAGDLILGARLADTPGGYNAGKVYVIRGSGGSPIPDVDLNGNPGRVTRILGEKANDVAGQWVSTGDLDRDGFDDVIVGAPGSFLAEDRESESPGKAIVIYGGAALPPVMDLRTDPGRVSRISGANGFAPDAGFSDRTGQSVASGDFNGDGYSDLIVGAPGADPLGRIDAGRVYLLLAGPKPDLRVSASGLAFGSAVVGQSRAATLVVTNAGTATLQLNTVTVTNGQFDARPLGSLSLQAGDSLLVAVTFSPTVAGPQAGTLTITTSNDPEKASVTLALSGTGAQPDIDVPPLVSFGQVALGSPAVSTLLISNPGTSDLTVTRIAASDSQFVVRPDSIVVTAGSQMRVTVIFTPILLGKTTATLTLTSDDPDEGSVIVALSGSAAAPRASVSSSTLAFGSVLIGSSFETKLTVSNLGDADLKISRLASDNAQFAVFPTAFTVRPLRDQQVSVTFTPRSIGAQAGTLTLSTDDPARRTLTIGVSGDGGRQAAIEVSATELNFGAVDVGASRDTSLILHNRGDGILSLLSALSSDPQFRAQPDSSTVGGEDSIRVRVSFSPSSERDVSAVLLIASNDPISPNTLVTLTGQGALRVTAEVTTGALDFGEVEVGTSKELTVTLYSRGNARLILTGAVPSDTQFVAQVDSFVVVDGDSARIPIVFTPTSVREVSATLTIMTNDFARGAIPVSLRGSGVKTTRLFLDLDPAAGNQRAATDTVQTRSCSATVSLYVEDALNLSDFDLLLRFSSGGHLTFRSFSDVREGEENFLRSAGGALTLSAQAEGNAVRLRGNLTNPSPATAPDGGGLLAVLEFQTFSTAERLAGKDSALVSVDQAVFLRLNDATPDTLLDAPSAKLVFSGLPGDSNTDGHVDMSDFFILAGAFGTRIGVPPYTPTADLNRDGAIDVVDFFLFAERMGTQVQSCRMLMP